METNDAMMFHTIVAKLLYLAKRTRPDILTVISLLCSRVQSPTFYDKNLLGRVVCYIIDTIGYGLKFSNSGFVGQLIAYCDAAYGIGEGFRSRSGIAKIYGDVLSPASRLLCLCQAPRQSLYHCVTVLVLYRYVEISLKVWECHCHRQSYMKITKHC